MIPVMLEIEALRVRLTELMDKASDQQSSRIGDIDAALRHLDTIESLTRGTVELLEGGGE